MDWVVHLTDDGKIHESMSANEFFQVANKEHLLHVFKSHSEVDIVEQEEQNDGIIKDEEDEVAKVNFGVFMSFF